MEEDNKLQTFTLQMQLPAPNLEVAKRVADEAQRLIDIYGYYNFLNQPSRIYETESQYGSNGIKSNQ
nr:MAG: hypothetical protein [Bacteriophage sp.]